MCDGKVKTWGLINSIRDTDSNPLLPSAYSFPLEVTPDQKRLAEKEIAALVRASGVKYGSFNIEMIIDGNGRLFFLDAGPRNGGNMLPDYISLICGGDIVEATVLMSVGEKPSEAIELPIEASQCWGLAVLHSPKTVLFDHLEYTGELKECIVREEVFAKAGDIVEGFETCTGAFGFVFLEFKNEAQKQAIMNHLNDHITIV